MSSDKEGRRRAPAAAREAVAWAAGGGVVEAVTGLLSALRVLTSAGGAKTRWEIVAVHRRLATRWPDNAPVVELGAMLTGPEN